MPVGTGADGGCNLAAQVRFSELSYSPHMEQKCGGAEYHAGMRGFREARGPEGLLALEEWHHSGTTIGRSGTTARGELYVGSIPVRVGHCRMQLIFAREIPFASIPRQAWSRRIGTEPRGYDVSTKGRVRPVTTSRSSAKQWITELRPLRMRGNQDNQSGRSRGRFLLPPPVFHIQDLFIAKLDSATAQKQLRSRFPLFSNLVKRDERLLRNLIVNPN